MKLAEQLQTDYQTADQVYTFVVSGRHIFGKLFFYILISSIIGVVIGLDL